MTHRHEDSDDDTYVTLGSAFEKLETVEDVEKAKRKKDKEHYVTDEQGRRRFHGAFTGGFSAGYFNTVGSKEGWTPSTFVSSKQKKADWSSQRPEDFMDDEDLGEFGIAPRAVTARDTFNKQKETAESAGLKRQAEFRSVIPGQPPLQNLIIPARSTVGAELLRSMGWKEGQGVGPKVAKYSSDKSKGAGFKKVYGCVMPGSKEEEEAAEVPKEAEGFLFAPKDVIVWEFEGKDDAHGIGYSGIAEQQVLGSRKTTKALYGMSGEAFGTGALDEENEEEEDVYGVEAITSYDSTLASERDLAEERKFGWTGGLQDGWSLSSFKKASKYTTNTKKHPPPDVPREFVCKHVFTHSSDETVPPSATDVPNKPLTSRERSQLLSDKPASVFDLLSHSDRERLKNVRQSTLSGNAPPTATPGSHDMPGPHVPQAPQAVLPSPAPPTAKPDVRTFQASEMKPFSRDPAKQARYEAHLAGKAIPAGPTGMTEWERQKEQEEFSRAAKVFQPLVSSLSSRFTRATDQETAEEGRLSEKPTERPLTPESDAVQAAKANMFGLLTREVKDWHPHRLICKRFNIPDPYPNSSLIGVATEKEKRKIFGDSSSRSISFLHTERMLGDERPQLGEREAVNGGGRNLAESRSGVEGGRSNVRHDEATSEESAGPIEEVVQERPSMDLFRNIFAESSSESSDSEDQENTTAETTSSSTVQPPPPNQRKWQDLSAIAASLTPPAAATGQQTMATREGGGGSSMIDQQHASGPFLDESYYQGARERNGRVVSGLSREGSGGGQRKDPPPSEGTEVSARDPGAAVFGPPLPEPAAFGPSLPPDIGNLSSTSMDEEHPAEESRHKKKKKDKSPRHHHKVKKHHKHSKDHRKSKRVHRH